MLKLRTPLRFARDEGVVFMASESREKTAMSTPSHEIEARFY